MLIHSFKERQSRSINSRSLVLKFLRDETWSNLTNLQSVVAMSESATFKVLQKLERDRMLVRYKISELRLTLWGISAQGLAFAWEEDELMEIRPYFEPSKISVATTHHYLDVQRARLAAQKLGWTHWIPGHQLPLKIKKRPDAVVTNSHGQVVAVEVERSIKTLKRYESIFAIYLQMIKKGDYQVVHYVCPDPDFAPRLKRMFQLIKTVPVAGERVPITDRHLARFPVFALRDWPEKA